MKTDCDGLLDRNWLKAQGQPGPGDMRCTRCCAAPGTTCRWPLRTFGCLTAPSSACLCWRSCWPSRPTYPTVSQE